MGRDLAGVTEQDQHDKSVERGAQYPQQHPRTERHANEHDAKSNFPARWRHVQHVIIAVNKPVSFNRE